MIKKPPFRRLRGYAFDPSLSLQIDTAIINNITYKVPWDDNFIKINKSWLSTMPNDLLGAELIRKTKGKLYFVGNRAKILPNIKTNRVIIKQADEKKLNDLNKKFDGKGFIECAISGS